MKKNFALIALAVFVVATITVFIIRRDTSRIESWATDNGYSVLECEMTIFDNGPFWWRDENHSIYKVLLVSHSTDEKRTSYFRLSLLGIEQAWEK